MPAQSHGLALQNALLFGGLRGIFGVAKHRPKGTMQYHDLHPVIRATIEGRRARPNRPTTCPALCYVIQADDNGPVKVGYAQNVAARLATLQMGNPAPLRVRYTFTDGIQAEAVLHDLLSPYALSGEWFTPAALPTVAEWSRANPLHRRDS